MENQDKNKCSRCLTYRQKDQFIRENGISRKTCNKCALEDKLKPPRPDKKEKTRARNKEAKNYVKYREQKRSEDEPAYLAKQAENARNYRNKKTDKKWLSRSFLNAIVAVKNAAIDRKILWDGNLTDEICWNMKAGPCFYCGNFQDNFLIGIDRKDNNVGYTSANCVGCCKICNSMKQCLDPKTFTERCQHISNHLGGKGGEFSPSFNNSNAASYETYKNGALKRNLDFRLTKTHYYNFIHGNCHYCNKKSNDIHTNGIDRMDNNVGYLLENCVSCCNDCNMMKKNIEMEIFIDQCKKISANCCSGNVNIIEVIPVQMKNLAKRKKEIITEEKHRIAPIVHEKAPVYVPIVREYIKGQNLPENVNFDIPKYCYYVPATEKRGDAFSCDKSHPIHDKSWKSTSSKRVSTEEKFKQLLSYLNNEFYTPKEEIELVKKLPKESSALTPEDKFALCSEAQFLEIIEMKSHKKTTQDCSDYIKSNFGFSIHRNFVSKLWNGEVEVADHIKKSNEYVEMLNNKKKRVYAAPKSEKFLEAMKNNKEKRRAFTEEHLISILRDKKDYTLTSESCGKKYTGVNGKSLHRGTIENIWNGKLEPLDKSSIPEYDELINFKRSRKEVSAAKLKE